MEQSQLALYLMVTVLLWYHTAGTSDDDNLFPGMLKQEKLSKFIDRVIRPDTEFNRRSKETIDKLVRSIQTMSGPFKSKIKGVVKGGSLGKGTHVKDKSDIDLIVFFNGYDSVKELQADKPVLLERLKEHITKEWSEHLTFKAMTPFSVQFRMKVQNGDQEHEVDLLPALDISKSGRSLSDIYSEMKGLGQQERGAYSSCLAPLQVNFVTATDRVSTPGKVKDLIRLLKYWAEEENVPIRSYFIELLVVNLWRKEKKPQNIDMEDSLRKILQQLVDIENMGIAFNDNYSYQDYAPQQKKPFLLDPANPFRNVAPNPHDSELVSKKAKLLLGKMGTSIGRTEL